MVRHDGGPQGRDHALGRALPGKVKRSKAEWDTRTVAETNARGLLAGPFLNHAPRLPADWTGVGDSYGYVAVGGGFLVCASGDGFVVNSVGGRDCP